MRDYEQADVIPPGVPPAKRPPARTGAPQYGIFAANFPLTDDELTASFPIMTNRKKLFGLTIAATIAADSAGATLGRQVRECTAGEFQLRTAERLFKFIRSSTPRSFRLRKSPAGSSKPRVWSGVRPDLSAFWLYFVHCRQAQGLW